MYARIGYIIIDVNNRYNFLSNMLLCFPISEMISMLKTNATFMVLHDRDKKRVMCYDNKFRKLKVFKIVSSRHGILFCAQV